MVLFFGYASLRDWDVADFVSSYTILVVNIILYFFWKFLKKTKIKGKYDIDLVWERPSIDAYEATFIDPPVGFWREMGQLVGIKRSKEEGGNDRRQGSVSN